jgi:hypothetical protein
VHVGVTYVEDDQIYVTLLNPDGTRAMATDTTLPHPYGETIGYRPRIVWNGSEYAIVWTTYMRTRFARVSSSGALVGAPVQLAGEAWSARACLIPHSCRDPASLAQDEPSNRDASLRLGHQTAGRNRQTVDSKQRR